MAGWINWSSTVIREFPGHLRLSRNREGNTGRTGNAALIPCTHLGRLMRVHPLCKAPVNQCEQWRVQTTGRQSTRGSKSNSFVPLRNIDSYYSQRLYDGKTNTTDE